MFTSAQLLAALPQEIKGWLGKGIDLFQCEPFEPPSTKPARLLSSSLPQDFRQIESLPATKYNETYADSLLEITHALTVEAGLKGSYGVASGSVESKFGFSQNRTEKRHLLQISFVSSAASYNITGNEEALKQQLDGDFKYALENWNVDDLFNVYGTHLIIKMIIGGRAEYFCQSSDLSSINKSDFRVAAMAKYESAGGSLEGSGSVGSIDSTKQQLVSGSINITTRGGSAKWATKLRDGAWSRWVESIATDPGFLGFDKQNGLMPIWKLANPARRTAIQEAYKRKAAKALRTEILSVTSDVDKHPVARVTVPGNYKLVGGGARDNSNQRIGNMLTASFPESPNTWMAAGKDHKESDPASITAFAVAIYDPDDLWDVKIGKSAAGNEEPQPMRMQPVESGYVMVGGGAQVLWSGEGHLLFASYAMDSNTWRGHSKWHWKQSAASLVAYAIGLKCKLKEIRVKSAIQQAQSNESTRPSATASVASEGGEDYVMTGGGAAALYKDPGVLLTASYPKDGKTWEGKGKDHIDGCSTAIVVQCIGVKVGDA